MGPADDQRLIVLDARAQRADVDDPDLLILKASTDRRHERQALGATAFLFEHASGWYRACFIPSVSGSGWRYALKSPLGIDTLGMI